MTCSKERKSEYVFFSIMFLLLMLFFSYINPLVLYDGDDWQQLSFIRKALPQWHGWNPVKVLPETLMPSWLHRSLCCEALCTGLCFLRNADQRIYCIRICYSVFRYVLQDSQRKTRL